MKVLQVMAAMLIIGMLFGCKKCKDDPPPTLTCEDGFEPINGTCGCPDGKYTVFDSCRGLRKNEFYGIRTDCPCEDTLLIQVRDIDAVNKKALMVLSAGMVYPIVAYFPSEVSRYVGYLPMPDGDSIFSLNYQTFPPVCAFNNDAASPLINAKFIAPDKLRAKFIYIDNNSPDTVATCTTIFHR